LNSMISKNLIKSSFIYTIIGALPLVSAFFLLLFYTNYLTTSLYGSLVIYVSFTGFIQILINLGLDTYIGISYFDSRRNRELLRSKIGTITGYLLIWGLFIILLFVLFGDNLFSLVFQGKDIFFFPYGFMSVLTAFGNSYFKTYSNLLINQEKPMRFAIVNLANFVMTIAFSLAGLFMFPETLIGPMWGRLLSGAGIFLIALFSLSKESVIRIRLGDELKQALNFSLPLLVFFIFSWSISNIYPFIIKYFMTLQDVAILGLVIQFTLLVEFVLNGLGSSIAPKIFGIIKDQDLKGSTPELNKYFSGFNAFALLLIPASTFFIPLILPFLISKDYEASYIFLSVLNIGFASRGLYNYFLTPIYLFKKTSILPKMYLITAIFQIIISIILIKYFGIWGAVAANLFTKIIQNYLLYLAARKFFTFRFSTMKFIWLPLFVTTLLIFSEYFITQQNLNLIRLSQMVFTYLLVYLFYRNEARALFKDLYEKFISRKARIV
jgi:O-antigen/teichoic acid export membrane protein